MAKRGHTVTVVYADRFGGPGKVPDEDGVKFEQIFFKLPSIFRKRLVGSILNKFGLTERMRFSFDSAQISESILKLNNKQPFDIIESPNNGATLCHLLEHFAGNNCCIRIATTDKDHSSINKTPHSTYLRRLFRAEGDSFRKCPNLVTHTNAHRDLICNEYGVSKDKFTIIPLSVRIPEESELLRTRRNPRKVVLFVGRFEKRKGIDIMLKIIPRVLSSRADIEFRLVGPDDTNSHEETFFSRNPKLRDQVVFLGEKTGEPLEDEYRNCDVFVAPSRYESFGLIYAEAMSFGRPAIGTNIGGIPEVITHEQTGLLCESENIDQFSSAILRLTSNNLLADKMGKEARCRAVKYFDFEKLLEDTESYYFKHSEAS